MPPHPDEFLYCGRGDVGLFESFVAEMDEPHAETFEGKLEIMRLTLAGRVDNGGEMQRVFVEQPPAENDLVTGRVIEGVVGRTRALPFNRRWAVLPYGTGKIEEEAEFPWVFKKMKVEVQLDIQQAPNAQTVSAADIPNIYIGTCEGDIRTSTYLCFPQLYREDGSTTLLAADREQLYNNCILPALLEVGSATLRTTSNADRLGDSLATSWSMIRKASKATMKASKEYRVWIDPDDLPTFLELLEESLDKYGLFKGWYFLHLVGRPPVLHSPEIPAEASEAWRAVEQLMTIRLRDKRDWKVLVGLRARSVGNAVFIRESSRVPLLSAILPQVPSQLLEHELERKNSTVPCYNYNNASTVQVSTAHLQGKQGVEHVYIQSQYHSPLNSELLTPADLYPSRSKETLRQLRKRLALLKQRIDQPNEVTTSVTIMTSYAVGRRIGTFALGPFAEVVEGGSWWKFLYYRLFGAVIAIQRLHKTYSRDRVSPSSLSLGAAAICVVNACSLPPQKRRWEEIVVERTSSSWAGPDADEEEWEVTFSLGEEQSFALARGMFFLSDIVELNPDSAILGVSAKYVVTGTQLAKVYGESTMAAVRSNMGVGSVLAIPDPASHTRHRNQAKISPLYNSLWTAVAPVRLDWTHLQSVRLLPTASWQKIDDLNGDDDDNDDNDGDISGAASLLHSGDISVILDHIIHQFVFDVFFHCPSSRDHGPYVTISSEERYNMRIAYMQDNVLPLTSAHLQSVYPQKWHEVVNRLFPPQGYCPPLNARIYSRCMYFHAWVGLLNRLTPQEAATVRDGVHTRINSMFHWLPDAIPSGMWSATSRPEARWVTLPRNWTGTAPKIVVNPRKYQLHMLTQWTLRPVTRREQEIEEIDSDEDFIDDSSE
ncbi:hypothetical protein BDY19DRAFT_904419 [Irpex rosettiformis]|uniref:Uncharacterized protein n=1 Tax=Irpex rosettiformis TaxID=378272 RepID=A0ACB8UC67_9APHY|nr:hypothetical protein BDY19DRAFT_904419 [Irpex rosettiformis]